jgi:hypothetical protein
MDQPPKSHLECMLDNLPDRTGPTLAEQLDRILERELKAIQRQQARKERRRVDFLPPYLRVVK